MFFINQSCKRVRILFLALVSSLFLNTFSFPATPDFSKNVGIGTAITKLPLGILADYYDCRDEVGKALIFESLYLATDVADTAMKMYHHSEDVSFFEMGFSVYHLIRFCKKIREFSIVSQDSNSAKQNNNEKNNLYKTLKYIGLIGDSIFSLGFSAESADHGSTRCFCSWLGSCLKLISTYADTKKSEFDLKNYLLFASISTVGTVLFREFIREAKRQKQALEENKQRQIELEELLKEIRNLGIYGRDVVKDFEVFKSSGFVHDGLYLNKEEWSEKLRKLREELLEKVRRRQEARRGFGGRGGSSGFRPAPDPFGDDFYFFSEFFRDYAGFRGGGIPSSARSAHPAGPTYYDVLGVDRSSSEREISVAYRKRALKVHPDKHGGKDDMFKLVGAAKDILSDTQKRREYDNYLKTGFLPPQIHPDNLAVSPQLLADLRRAMEDKSKDVD